MLFLCSCRFWYFTHGSGAEKKIVPVVLVFCGVLSEARENLFVVALVFAVDLRAMSRHNKILQTK